MKKVYMLLIALMSAGTMVAQSNASEFTFSNIENWTGEGENSSALVIKWTDSEYSWVFGYKYDGEKTGYQMITDIVAANPRFYALALTASAYGAAIGGFGYDADNNGFTLLDGDGNTATPDETGLYVTTSYDFDDYTLGSTGDYWNSGWYNGYWSYYVTTDPANGLSYSNYGCSSRTLSNGDWDLWLFTPFSGGSNSWGDYKAMPAESSTAIDDVDAVKGVTSVQYVNLSGQTSSEPFNGMNIVVTRYTDGSTSSVKTIINK